LDGETVQHIEYVPFGEVFIEERNNTWNTPYLFNAKELDEETGLYYYGARYYDPRISLWLSNDPLQDKYPNISAYAYCLNNPIIRIDPDGNAWVEVIHNGTPSGVLSWDASINSAEDFAASAYDKSMYRYVGMETQRAYIFGSTSDDAYTVYYGADGTTSYYDYPNWVTGAESHIGLTEGNNPVIQAMIDGLNAAFGNADKNAKPISSDKEPWCGTFIFECLVNSGYTPISNSWITPAKASFYKDNWQNGTKIDAPCFGAIAVMNWGHVGTVVNYDSKYIWLLGGNQSATGAATNDGTEVNIKRYPHSSVSSYVLPASYNKPPLDTFE
jgi:uncharacterized protein (TIGR02594 family)